MQSVNKSTRWWRFVVSFAVLSILIPIFLPVVQIQADEKQSNQSTNYGYLKRSLSDTGVINGLVPQESWQPAGQKNVLNAQGGTIVNTAKPAWNHLKNVTTPDQHWMNVGSSQHPLYKMQEYATEVEGKKGYYDVVQRVMGTQTSSDKPVDVVLVADFSRSMAQSFGAGGKSRARVLADLVDKLINEMKSSPNPNNFHVGMVRYSSDSYVDEVTGANTAVNTNGSVPITPVDDKQLTIDINNLMGMGTSVKNPEQNLFGETFTQKGLLDGEKLLQQHASEDSLKYMILLTDGVPNRAYHVSQVQLNTGSSDVDSLSVSSITGDLHGYAKKWLDGSHPDDPEEVVEEGIPWTDLTPAKKVIPWTNLTPAKKVIPAISLTPAKGASEHKDTTNEPAKSEKHESPGTISNSGNTVTEGGDNPTTTGTDNSSPSHAVATGEKQTTNAIKTAERGQVSISPENETGENVQSVAQPPTGSKGSESASAAAVAAANSVTIPWVDNPGEVPDLDITNVTQQPWSAKNESKKELGNGSGRYKVANDISYNLPANRILDSDGKTLSSKGKNKMAIIHSVWPATLGAVHQIQNDISGIRMRGIGIQVAGVGKYSASDIKSRFEALFSSRGADGSSQDASVAFADDSTQFNSLFGQLLGEVQSQTQAITNGTINTTIGEHYKLDLESEPEVDAENGATSKPTVTVSEDRKYISVNGIHLTRNQVVTLRYRVKLKDSNNVWYPISGPNTTFDPGWGTDIELSNITQFAVPSGRLSEDGTPSHQLSKPVLTVYKWNEKYKSLKQSSFKLSKGGKINDKLLAPMDQDFTKFMSKSSGSDMLEYDTDYQLTEERAPKGYQQLQDALTIRFIQRNGKAVMQLELPKSEDGMATAAWRRAVNELPSAIKTSDGYELELDKNVAELHIMNFKTVQQPQSTSLTVEKVNADKQPLPGASFTVDSNPMNGSTDKKVMTANHEETTFTTSGLRLYQGYELAEVKAPDGYLKLQHTLTVRYDWAAGVLSALVTVTPEDVKYFPDLTDDLKLPKSTQGGADQYRVFLGDDNNLTLRVVNDAQAGVLPDTGGAGILTSGLIGSLLIGTSYWFFKKRRVMA